MPSDSKSSKGDRSRRDDRGKERDSRRDRSRSRSRDRKSARDKKDRRSRSRSKERREEKRTNDNDVKMEEEENAATTDLNTNGEIELSVDDMNKLRAKLGLKPLNAEPNKEKQEEQKKKQRELEEAAKEKQAMDVKARIALSKEERKYRDRIAGKSIAEEADEEDDSAASWVLKSRKLTVEQIQKEKELAEKRARILDVLEQVDPNEEDEDNAGKKSKYSSRDLQGLKVAHALDELASGEPVILTLEDTKIIGDGDNLNEEDDKLVNVNIAEKERHQKYQDSKKKKPIYNIYDDAEKSILSQYDEPAQKPTFSISIDGTVNTTSDQTIEDVRKKLNQPGKDVYSLDMSKSIANEYLTPQEAAVKFKKVVKKKKKIRSKTSDEILPLEDDSSAVNHASRNQSAKLIAEQKKAEEEKIKRDNAYKKAIDKAAEGSKALLEPKTIDDEDAEFFSKLQKSAPEKKKKETPDVIAKEIITRAKQREEEEMFSAKPIDPSLLFTTTTEFVKAIQMDDEPESNGIASSILNAAKMEVDPSIEEEAAEHEKMLQESIKKAKEKKEKPEDVKVKVEDVEMKDENKEESDEDEDKENGAEEEEPLVGEGIAATLKLLMKKGGPEPLDTFFGRRGDKTLEQEYARAPEKLRDPNAKKEIQLDHTDEYGRVLTPKEAFRMLSHKFHGKKPGKNKQEKRMKQYIEDIKKKKMSSTDTPLGTVQRLTQELEKSQTPFLVLSAPAVSRADISGLVFL